MLVKFFLLLKDGDFCSAIALMLYREDVVVIALSEYKPELHKVMKRPNKFRKNKDPGLFRAIMARKRSRVLCIIFFREQFRTAPFLLTTPES